MTETFLIGMKGKGFLWCRGSYDAFTVINGHWRGSLVGDVVEVERSGHRISGCAILWQGVAPFDDAEYNDAIHWIEEQVAKVPL